MKHFHDIEIAAGTKVATWTRYEFNVDKGLITWCGVFFPPGCHGTVYAKIFFQTHQILPRNQEGWCHGNGDWWQGDLYFPVTAAPLKIVVYAYGNNTLFAHTITVGLELTPFTMIPAWDKLIGVLTRIAKGLGIFVPKPQQTEMTP